MITGVSCLSGRKVQSEPGVRPESFEERALPPQTVVPDTFVLPALPETMKDPRERAEYLVLHYWDRFDFADRGLIARPEITEQAFADYVNILACAPEGCPEASLAYTLRMAGIDSVMYVHFAELFEKYLYDPNSPFRNEEYYLPVLRELAASPLLTEGKRSRYGFQLDMALRNRKGDRASDFTCTDAEGKSFRLHDLKCEYTLLMFTDPGCSTCAAVTKRLGGSETLNGVLDLNTGSRIMLTVLALSPDSNREEWSARLAEMPARWLCAYDRSGEIIGKRLYSLRALPSLYLLDRDKRVILKDTSIEAIESFFSIR